MRDEKVVQAEAGRAALARVRVQPVASPLDCAAPVLPVKPAWPCSRRTFKKQRARIITTSRVVVGK
jgi:hypothetical protein